jgi:hypothetical protein
MLQKRYYTQVIHSISTVYTQENLQIPCNSQDTHRLSPDVEKLWIFSYPQAFSLAQPTFSSRSKFCECGSRSLLSHAE